LHDAINIHPLGQILNGLASSNSRTPRNVVMMAYLHFCTERALRRADMLLTVSDYSKREIAHYSDFEPERIVPIFHGQAPDIHKIEDGDKLAEVRRKFDLARPFVLADALKNPIVLVKAWRRLPADMRDRFQIVFFSRRPDPLPLVPAAEAAGAARLLIRPERDDLITLFSMAEAFVFPSWIEGFGLPLLEAMTCGAPIIASDRGSIPEVAGEAAIITDAEDDSAMADYLQRVLCDPAEAARLRAKGFARVAQFTWQNTARQILSAYEQVLA
jgi:glycosyltransferase involved in cell wall biosynthesis